MGELSDAWAAQGKPNVWGDLPQVIEMQSEAGAAAPSKETSKPCRTPTGSMH